MTGLCPHCQGNHLVRNGVCRAYKRQPEQVGVRYLCRDCKRTHMIRVDERADMAFTRQDRAIPSGGRPIRFDWRFA